MRELTIAMLAGPAEAGHHYEQALAVQTASDKRDVKQFRNAENLVSFLSSSSVDILVALHPTWAMYDAMSRGVVLVTSQRNRYLWHMNNSFWIRSPAISDIDAGIHHLLDKPQLLSTISKQAKRIHHRCNRRCFADSFLDASTRAESSPKPKDADSLYHQGVLKMSRKRYAEAMVDFKQSLELSMRSRFIDKAYVWRQMATCYEKLKNPQAALSALEMSEKFASGQDDAAILVTRMRALASTGKHEEALSIFREIEADDKTASQIAKEAAVIAASLLARLGDEQYRRGELAAAADAYREANHLNPKVATYVERWKRLRDKMGPPGDGAKPQAKRPPPKLDMPQPAPSIPASPLVSVIIPCYNDEDVIADSVQCALKQTVSGIEVIIVDDGSTDSTRRILAALDDERITVAYKRNGGPSSARNMALRLASKSKFVAFLDSDDHWESIFLEKCIAALEDGGPTCGLAYCNSRLTHDGEFVEVIRANYSWDRLIDSWGMIPIGSFTIRHQVITRAGPFNEEIERGEDLEWMWRVGARYEFVHVDEVLHHYCRSSKGQLSTSPLNSRLLNACRSECLAVRAEGQGIAQ